MRFFEKTWRKGIFFGMKKKLKEIFLFAAVAALFLCGCGQTDQELKTKEAREKGEVAFVDDLGRQVVLGHPDKAAALIGSFADIWLLAGGELTAAANDSWDSLGLPLDEGVVNLGSITEPDVEQLIASGPDLVLASANTAADLELEGLLTGAGIPVAYFAVSNFEEYLHMLDICTRLTGRRDLYEEHGLKVEEEIAKVLERVDGSAPTVLFLRASASSVKAKGSEGNVCGEMLADLGCVNIADSEGSLTADKGSLVADLSMEAVIAADPDYIFVTLQGSDQEAAMENMEQLLLQHPAWSNLTAVKENRYYMLDKRLFNLKPNARWGEAYTLLADILYP